jgi:hypothetical protein
MPWRLSMLGTKPAGLEHVPPKRAHFGDKKHAPVLNTAHFLIGDVIPTSPENARAKEQAKCPR